MYYCPQLNIIRLTTQEFYLPLCLIIRIYKPPSTETVDFSFTCLSDMCPSGQNDPNKENVTNICARFPQMGNVTTSTKG